LISPCDTFTVYRLCFLPPPLCVSLSFFLSSLFFRQLPCFGMMPGDRMQFQLPSRLIAGQPKSHQAGRLTGFFSDWSGFQWPVKGGPLSQIAPFRLFFGRCSGLFFGSLAHLPRRSFSFSKRVLAPPSHTDKSPCLRAFVPRDQQRLLFSLSSFPPGLFSVHGVQCVMSPISMCRTSLPDVFTFCFIFSPFFFKSIFIFSLIPRNPDRLVKNGFPPRHIISRWPTLSD